MKNSAFMIGLIAIGGVTAISVALMPPPGKSNSTPNGNVLSAPVVISAALIDQMLDPNAEALQIFMTEIGVESTKLPSKEEVRTLAQRCKRSLRGGIGVLVFYWDYNLSSTQGLKIMPPASDRYYQLFPGAHWEKVGDTVPAKAVGFANMT